MIVRYKYRTSVLIYNNRVNNQIMKNITIQITNIIIL